MQFLNMSFLIGLGKVLSIISGILFARFLGPEEYGTYAFLMSLLVLLSIPTTAGMQNLIIRNLSLSLSERNNDISAKFIQWSIKHIVYLSLATSSLLLLSYVSGFISFMSPNIILFFILFILARGVLVFSNGILITYDKAPLSYFITQATPQFLIILTFISIGNYYQIDHTSLFIITSSFFIAASIISLQLSLNKIKGIKFLHNLNPSYTFNEKGWGNQLIVFSGIVIISTLISEFAIITLGIFHNQEDVAFFKIAYQSSVLILLPLTAVNLLIAPKISALYTENKSESLQKIIKQSTYKLILLALPIFLPLFIFSSEAIGLIFGEQYMPANNSLRIISVGFLVSLIFGPVAITANMMKLEKNLLSLMFFNSIFTILLMIFLIPTYRIEGAAVAVTVSTVCWSTILSVIINRKRNIRTWIH